MTRVTIEDCLDKVENRFSLVHATTKRTKMIFNGSQPLVQCKNREIVTALREIAESKVTINEIELEEEKPKKGKKKK